MVESRVVQGLNRESGDGGSGAVHDRSKSDGWYGAFLAKGHLSDL